jgi:hypothetical protein
LNGQANAWTTMKNIDIAVAFGRIRPPTPVQLTLSVPFE